MLIAVSGGSDSLALLHQLADTHPHGSLQIATVDHQLRPESATEAKFVAEISAKLGLPHTILHWENLGQSSSKAAREGRYKLLVAHAKAIGAASIALGHTMDDQAETILMRAKRMTPTSGTRGLSGMVEKTTYDGITLLRPLLNTRREIRKPICPSSPLAKPTKRRLYRAICDQRRRPSHTNSPPSYSITRSD